MSNTSRKEVLFKELGDEDIACVSGGITVSSSSSVLADGTAIGSLTINGQTTTVTSPPNSSNPSTGNSGSQKKSPFSLTSPLVPEQVVGQIILLSS